MHITIVQGVAMHIHIDCKVRSSCGTGGGAMGGGVIAGLVCLCQQHNPHLMLFPPNWITSEDN